MATIEEVEEAPPEAQEEWFLENLENETLPTGAMIRLLDRFAEAGEARKCREWADMLQDALEARQDGRAMLALLEARLAWVGDSPEFKKTCHRALRAACKDRLGSAIVEAVGFQKNRDTPECLRRTGVLFRLKEGAFCHDGTWGFGVVRRVDDFYKKITIDFSKKSNHPMSFAYACETLEVVDDDHLLAIRHARGGALEALVEEEPDEVVRIALRSYGPMSATRLQELLTEEVFEESRWRGFWEKARKRLKADPLVDLPLKRSEPIRLLDREKAYDDDWFSGLAAERDPKRILELASELMGAIDLSDLSAGDRGILGERLDFSFRGVEGHDPALAVRLLLMAGQCGFGLEEDSPFRMQAATDYVGTPAVFLQAVSALPARDFDRLVGFLEGVDLDAAQDLLMSTLWDMPSQVLAEAMARLVSTGRETDIASQVRAALSGQDVSGAMLLYLCQNMERLEAWQLGSLSDLLHLVIRLLSLPGGGERLKIQKLLKAQFEDKPWLESVLARLDDRERSKLMTTVRESRGWEEASRRSVMARMIKLYPELERVAAKAAREPGKANARIRFTSWRSYRERQEQLRTLVEVTIPENSREIGVARSYGDLRENFEYQAAKDQQGLLMRRKAEIERDLAEVRGSDFSGVRGDAVGLGMGVDVRRPDGSINRFWILGEWDRDESLGIISSRSEMAKRLEGCRSGDEVALPSDSADAASRVVAVLELNDEVRHWMSLIP